VDCGVDFGVDFGVDGGVDCDDGVVCGLLVIKALGSRAAHPHQPPHPPHPLLGSGDCVGTGAGRVVTLIGYRSLRNPSIDVCELPNHGVIILNSTLSHG
jgi:hypothetical protein